MCSPDMLDIIFNLCSNFFFFFMEDFNVFVLTFSRSHGSIGKKEEKLPRVLK